MDGTKLDISGQQKTPTIVDPAATYKAIAEVDMEEEAVTRPKSIVKTKLASPEIDGADEKMLPNEDKIELKLSPNDKQNGDAKLDIGDLRTAFVGLTKEELMKYANDPFWVRLRWFLFITFWLLWGVMLLGAILIILAAPKCDPPPPKTWWEKGPLIELGDKPESQNIALIKENAITGVIIPWMGDTYEDLDESHDFAKTIKKFNDENIKVIVELEPGTSNVWFNRSLNKDPTFSNYYIWQPGKVGNNGSDPPNNWLTVENKTSWVFSRIRREYYYAPTGKAQLNLRNSDVVEAFSKVINKFVGFGANGVRLRNVSLLLADSSFDNEITNPSPRVGDLTTYGFYAHTKTENLLELGPLLQQWKVIVKNLTDNGPFMIDEDLNNIEAYKVNNSYVVDLPSQSYLFSKPNSSVFDLMKVLNATFKSDNITWPAWKVNSTSDLVDIMTYLLPGTPVIKTGGRSVNKDLLKIRDTPSIMRGSFDFYSLNNGSILAFVRVLSGNPGILVAVNPTSNRTTVDFPKALPMISDEVTVQLLSKNYTEHGVELNVKQKAENITLSPHSAIVLSYVPKQ